MKTKTAVVANAQGAEDGHPKGEFIELTEVAGDKISINFLYHITIGEKNKGMACVAVGRTAGDAEEHAQRIVKAVNMHDDLLDFVREVKEMATRIPIPKEVYEKMVQLLTQSSQK